MLRAAGVRRARGNDWERSPARLIDNQTLTIVAASRAVEIGYSLDRVAAHRSRVNAAQDPGGASNIAPEKGSGMAALVVVVFVLVLLALIVVAMSPRTSSKRRDGVVTAC